VCTTIITCVFFCRYPSSCADNPTTLAQQNADSKTEFQSPYWNLVSDQAKSFSDVSSFLITSIILPPKEALRDPWYISTTTTTTTTDLPSHVDLSPTLISSRAKWYNTNIMASTNLSYFAATAAASRTQSSGGWNDQNSSPRVVTQALGGEG